MAELIPLHYRARLAVRQRVRLWTIGGALVVALCAATLVVAGVWTHAAATEAARLRGDFVQQSSLIQRSEELQRRRQELADRMKKIEGLRDDKTLLALLRNVAGGFAVFDSLEYIHINVRGPRPTDAAAVAAAATDSDTSHFVVRMSGITTNTSSLADLMTRIGKARDPALQVKLESSKRENYLDGQVTRFQMTCEKPGTTGS